MPLENELLQKEFRNPAHKALVGILFTANLIEGQMESVYEKYDLTRQQYNVLRILRGHYPNPLTIQAIRSRMIDRMSDASRISERLQVKGLVERSTGKFDRRATEVVISSKGLAILEILEPIVNGFERWFDSMDPEVLESFNSTLEKIIHSFQGTEAFLLKSGQVE